MRRISYGRGRRRRVVWLPIVLFALYFGYTWLTGREEAPLTGRTQLINVSREQETALGLQSYSEILSQSAVLREGEIVEQVRAIGRRLAGAAADDDPGFDWEFNVIQSDQANAFCLPGGKVAVYTGLIPIAQNVDGLAVIMGHEIAHAIARHGAERMTQQRMAQLGTMAAGMALSEMDQATQSMVMGALGVGTQYGILLPFSREHESEADYMGLVYAARSCFDPEEAPLLWERMGEASGGGAPAEFASTHPSHQTRVAQFGEWMPEALEIRRTSCGE